MSEEVEVVVDSGEGTKIPGEEQGSSMQPDNKPEVSEYEEEARNSGWRPKDEWQGDPNKWRPAKEFVERGELFGKIDTLGRDLKDTKKALKMLQEHHTKVRETEYTRAVNELKALQKQHLESGNSEGYLETSELLTDIKAEQKAREVLEANTPQQPQQDPRFMGWVEKNKWYAQDNQMRAYADNLGLGYAQQNPGIDPEEVLKYVTAEVRTRFKDRFTNPNRKKPSEVEGANTNESPRKGSIELSAEERKVMHTFVRAGVMTEAEYIDEVKKLRGVK